MLFDDIQLFSVCDRISMSSLPKTHSKFANLKIDTGAIKRETGMKPAVGQSPDKPPTVPRKGQSSPLNPDEKTPARPMANPDNKVPVGSPPPAGGTASMTDDAIDYGLTNRRRFV